VPHLSKYKGVLLDIDGTLIDSNDAHARSWVDAFREFDYDVTFEQVRPLVGMGGDKLMAQLTGLDNEKAKGKEIADRKKKVFAERYLETLRAFPGAHELLARMKQHGLRLVIATSAGEDEMNDLLEQAGLNELVQRRTSSDDAERSKPDPDIVKAALSRAQLQSGDAVMIGDTPYDISAAKRANVDSIAFRCGGWWRDQDLAGAAAIYDGPAELLDAFETSPLGSPRTPAVSRESR
jgi:HAD superfamily hydrolase (TIGR01549 family)